MAPRTNPKHDPFTDEDELPIVHEPKTMDLDPWGDVVSDESYDEIVIGIGEKIDWETEEVFFGTYDGTTEQLVPAEKSQTGTDEMVMVHLFTQPDGTKRFAWKAANLDIGLREMPHGSKIGIKWMGINEIGKGRTVNIFRVLKKREEAK